MLRIDWNIVSILRSALLTLSAVTLLVATPVRGQAADTGIVISVVDWLPLWDPDTGGWGATPAGSPPGKWSVWSVEDTASVAPGTYDIYWLQDGQGVHGADFPLMVAESVEVTAGDFTLVRIATGVMLSVADWVPPMDPNEGWWGAVPAGGLTNDLTYWTRSATALVLPEGEYDFHWMNNEEDDHPSIWFARATVEPPFGGIGVEVSSEDGRGVIVVRIGPG